MGVGARRGSTAQPEAIVDLDSHSRSENRGRAAAEAGSHCSLKCRLWYDNPTEQALGRGPRQLTRKNPILPRESCPTLCLLPSITTSAPTANRASKPTATNSDEDKSNTKIKS